MTPAHDNNVYNSTINELNTFGCLCVKILLLRYLGTSKDLYKNQTDIQ